MSVDDELRRHLQARAAGARGEPDLEDLARRIRASERRAARGERIAVTAAAIVLAGSLGGLVGALVRAPATTIPRITEAGGQSPLGTSAPPHRRASAVRREVPAQPAERVALSVALPGGVSVRADVQPLGSAVAIDGVGGSFSFCSSGRLVTSTVASGSSLAVGTAVTGLVPLGNSGLEVLSSGTVPLSSGGELWWLTVAVGTSVKRVAAEGVDGAIVSEQPARGLAVLAATSTAAETSVSAVGESAGGQSLASLQVQLGSGPKVVDAPPPASGSTAVSARSGGAAPSCTPIGLPAAPSSASASQPAAPQLAAASVIGSYEQAFSPSPLEGYASNLAAVDHAVDLGAGVVAGGSGPQLSPAGPGRRAGNAVVVVRQVTFLSASRAEVVYRLSDGIWRTGSAVLGAAGSWQVSLDSYCSAVRADAGVAAPASVAAACASRQHAH